MHNSGVLTLGTHNICYSLTEADIRQIKGAYKRAFQKLRVAIDSGDFQKHMKCPKITPVFKVR